MSSSGLRLAIGYPDDDTTFPNAGKVEIFDWNGTEWDLIEELYGDDPGGLMGRSVALSSNGSRLIVGSYLYTPSNDTADLQKGRASVYEYDGSSYDLLGQDLDGERLYDHFGRYVAINGDGTRIAVGRLLHQSHLISSTNTSCRLEPHKIMVVAGLCIILDMCGCTTLMVPIGL